MRKKNYFQPIMLPYKLKAKASLLEGSNEAYRVIKFNIGGSSSGAKSMEFEEEE